MVAMVELCIQRALQSVIKSASVVVLFLSFYVVSCEGQVCQRSCWLFAILNMAGAFCSLRGHSVDSHANFRRFLRFVRPPTCVNLRGANSYARPNPSLAAKGLGVGWGCFCFFEGREKIKNLAA